MKTIVCIIDRDPAVRDSLETLMNLNGRNVVTYATGNAFLNEFDSCKPQYVICEAHLPDTSGFAIFNTLSKRNSVIPFALLLSRNDRGIYEQALRIGITHIFAKPLMHRKLTEFVSNAC